MREGGPFAPDQDAAVPQVSPVASKGPSTLRRDLLLRLRLDGPSSPDQLAERLGASRTGVLQQLRALEDAHLVSRQTVRHGVGRPRHLYDVTADAQDLFPSNYDALASGLLAAIEAVGGDDLLDQVFAARRRQLGAARPGADDRSPGTRTRRWSNGSASWRSSRPTTATSPTPSSRSTARSACASTTARSSASPRRRRPPARRSSSSSARSSARTWSASRTSPPATAAAPTGSAARRTRAGPGRPDLRRGAARGRYSDRPVRCTIVSP